MENHEIEPKAKSWEEEAVLILKTAFVRFGQGMTSLLGLWVVAYLVGLLRVFGYYWGMGCLWIIPELSSSYVLYMSCYSVCFVIFGILASFSDQLSIRHIRKNTFMFASVIIGLLSIMVVFLVVSYKSYESLYPVFFYGLNAMNGIILGDQIRNVLVKEKTVIRSTNKSFNLSYFVGITGTALTLFGLGLSEGCVDKNPLYSGLDYVKVKNGEESRLLFVKESLIYSVSVKEDLAPMVKIYSVNDLEYISRERHP